MLLALPLQARDRHALPTPFGEDLYLASESQPVLLPPRLGTPDAEQWQRRIEESEWASGPYGSGLSELLMDAGNYFRSRGDFGGAIENWRRAVHLIRVNDGLYSELQLPLLENLLQTYLVLADYEAAGEIHSYLYFLSQQYFQPGEDELVKAQLRYLEWRRQQWLRAPASDDYKPLYTLWRELNALTRDDKNESLPLSQLRVITYAQMDMLYVIGNAYLGLDREAELLFGRQYGASQGDIGAERTQLQMVQQSAYQRGRRRLQSLLERHAAESEPQIRAELLLRLGDWHSWYNYPKRAAESYLASWDLLAAAPELRRQWYDQPQELPANGLMFTGPVAVEEFADTALVEARFTVTEKGRPEGIATTARNPERDGAAIKVSKWLRSARFRPRLDQGAPVNSGPVVREYRVN